MSWQRRSAEVGAPLEEEGYECSEIPSVADLEAQLERALAAIEEGEQDVLFDRCPADILAYLIAHDDASTFEPDDRSGSPDQPTGSG